MAAAVCQVRRVRRRRGRPPLRPGPGAAGAGTTVTGRPLPVTVTVTRRRFSDCVIRRRAPRRCGRRGTGNSDCRALRLAGSQTRRRLPGPGLLALASLCYITIIRAAPGPGTRSYNKPWLYNTPEVFCISVIRSITSRLSGNR